MTDSRIDQGNEINGQIRAISAGLDALRERLDAELSLIHLLVKGIDAKLERLETRVTALEGRTYMSPEMMAAIEKSTRE